MQTREFNDVVERFIYAHQQSQLGLQEALAHATEQAVEAESQRRWDEETRQVALNTRFPQSIEAYEQITNPIHKLRVCRLLVAPTTEEKEQIAGPFPGVNTPENWTEAECMPLMGIFRADVSSRLDQTPGTVLTCSFWTSQPQFAEKVQRYIHDSQSTDPRRRPTA